MLLVVTETFCFLVTTAYEGSPSAMLGLGSSSSQMFEQETAASPQMFRHESEGLNSAVNNAQETQTYNVGLNSMLETQLFSEELNNSGMNYE